MTKEKIYITTKELAKRWVRSPRTIEGWRVKKTGPDYLDLNGKILYDLDEIIKFENASKVTHDN
ncbi:DNA-binding protein [Gammaproteobacteria bacterium]|nr:DNA-binding protein [Gammaproteobacteria bacterium]